MAFNRHCNSRDFDIGHYNSQELSRTDVVTSHKHFLRKKKLRFVATHQIRARHGSYHLHMTGV